MAGNLFAGPRWSLPVVRRSSPLSCRSCWSLLLAFWFSLVKRKVGVDHSQEASGQKKKSKVGVGAPGREQGGGCPEILGVATSGKLLLTIFKPGSCCKFLIAFLTSKRFK